MMKKKIFEIAQIIIIAVFLCMAALVIRPPILQVIQSTFTNQVQTLPDTVAATLDSCVHITNITQGWQGSAFAIAPDILVTARHIVKNGGEFLVTTADGDEFTAYQAVSSKEYDIAFIKLDESMLCPAKTGTLEDLCLGESVYMIGGSQGKRHWPNVTAGIVSHLNLDVEAFGQPKDYGWNILWQVDAASYGGNSGSPIFTLDGVARGILVGGPPGTECLSYCVPLDVAVPDLAVIQLLFVQDEYEIEEVPVVEWSDPYYNHTEDNDYYKVVDAR